MRPATLKRDTSILQAALQSGAMVGSNAAQLIPFQSCMLLEVTDDVQSCISSSGLIILHHLCLCLQDGELPASLRDADSTREAQLLESWKAYKKGFQQGIALFNKKPKKGIAYMQVSLSSLQLLRRADRFRPWQMCTLHSSKTELCKLCMPAIGALLHSRSNQAWAAPQMEMCKCATSA